MIIGRIAGATRIFGKPADMTDAECGALAVRDVEYDGRPAMVSAWYPTPQELFRLSEGAPIYLSIYGNIHPVVSLDVGENKL
jgi:hypothetical protein